MTRLVTLLRRLRGDTSGLALIEFALSFPLVAGVGLYSVELTNFALVTLKVNQITLNLADNAARVGTDAALSTQQLREIDMNDVLQAARYQGRQLNLTTNGRIIVSSLENVTGAQVIHWQRCIGLKPYDSSYGTTDDLDGTSTNVADAGTPAPNGMGEQNAKVNAPAGYGVMFVEVSYDYQPLISAYFIGSRRIHFIASYIVRDNRDFTRLYNPAPTAQASLCSRYTT